MTADRLRRDVTSPAVANLLAMLVAQIDGGAPLEAVRPILLPLGRLLAAEAEKALADAARAEG